MKLAHENEEAKLNNENAQQNAQIEKLQKQLSKKDALVKKKIEEIERLKKLRGKGKRERKLPKTEETTGKK